MGLEKEAFSPLDCTERYGLQHEKNVTMLEERIVHVKAQLEIKDTELNAQIKMQVLLSWGACCVLSVEMLDGGTWQVVCCTS